ncbi:uncharacterized protein LOC124293686 isoform X2 [Neodiprion lecontei]|uniref:Uncharacterized protein LOC124293686 isoform X2 n=1 Tax=Neodiprion lecontei TaxID=441921 RepID=A0ABM3FUA4_NEOLC|nr:uncharacterized protein LOC124293686 isoform X2 [Neodiprion lecontei]
MKYLMPSLLTALSRNYGALVLEVEIHHVKDLKCRNCGALVLEVGIHQVEDLEVVIRQVNHLGRRNPSAFILEVEFHQVAYLERRNYGAIVLEVEFHQVAYLKRRNYGPGAQDPGGREPGTRNLRSAIPIRPLYYAVVSRLRNWAS